MDQQEEALIQECLDIFSADTGPYEMSRQLSMENYTETGELDDESLMNFRKALQDMGVFFEHLDNGEISEAQSELESIKESLKETACESAKRTAQHKYDQVKEKKLKHTLLYKILLLDYPSAIREKLDRIEGRMEFADKNNPSDWRRSVAFYEHAFEIADELENDLPSRQEVRNQVIAAIVGVISIIGATVGVLSFLGYTHSEIMDLINILA